MIAFALLNVAGLAYAMYSGHWRLRQMYNVGVASDRHHHLDPGWRSVGAPGSNSQQQGEGHERRFFYGSVWAVCIAQPILWLLEGPSAHANCRCGQADRLCRHPRLGRQSRAARPAPTHATHSARRGDRLGLAARRGVIRGKLIAHAGYVLLRAADILERNVAIHRRAARWTARRIARPAMSETGITQ